MKPGKIGAIGWHIGLVGTVVLVYAAYYPLNAWTMSLPYHDLGTWIDRATPLAPAWMFAYVAIFASATMPGFVVRHKALLQRTAIAYLLVQCIAFVCFVLYPVQMTLRPEAVAVDSFATWGLKLCYFLDAPTTCFPSLHVATCVLGGLIVHKADPKLGRPLLGVALLVCASTMLVKQHFLADVVAGLLLSLVVHWRVVSTLSLDGLAAEEIRLPRYVSMGWIGVNLAAVGFMFALYRAGWQPWAVVAAL